MSRQGLRLAKLTRPRLARAMPRERLFKLLDRARSECSAVCVVGPPGAGKTTAVASWLEARKIRGIWYQVDAGDADLATFFHYLGQAGNAIASTRARPLPALMPEHLRDVAGFARRFFRELFARMPQSASLVLDNYQEVVAQEPLHALIAGAAAEVPAGITLIAVSRRDPPEVYARLIANGNVFLLDWDDLRLTLEEAQAIAQIRGAQLDRAQIAALHAQCDGWAAGLTLMLEDRSRYARSGEPSFAAGRDAIFDYFAAQIFHRAPEALRSFLLQTGYLPQVPVSLAEKLTGEARSAQFLADLHRRHLFTHRRAGEEPTYWYHALFRAFLMAQAEQLLSPEVRLEIQYHAASLLESGRMIEDAMQLYQRLGEVESAATLVVREAGRLTAQGRWKLVLDWVQALPAERVRADCWLMYWYGITSLATDPVAARERLEGSFQLAQRMNDELCQLQATAGIIENYLTQYTHFKPLDRWIRVLEEKPIADSAWRDTDVELRVQSALLMAMAKRQPGNPRLQGCVQRIFALLQVSGDVNLCVVAAMHLVYYGASTGPIEVGRRALPKLVALLGRPEVSALNATWAWVVASWFHCLCHDARSCSAAYERVQRLSEEHGLPWVARLAIVNRMWLDLFRFDPVEGRKWVERAELAADPYHPWDLGTLHGARGWLALCEGKPDVALDRGLKAVDVFDEAGSAMQRVNFRILVVIAYFESGQLELARQWAEQMRDIAGAGITSFQLASVLIWEANIALAQGDRNLMLDRLRQALHIGKRSETGFIFYNWCGPWMPRLCSEALAAGVEVEYVRELIREYEYLPPSPFEPLWPWPVRVFTLGEFALMRCGQPVEFGRKAPRRVLAVMKYLIAHGGKAVPLRQLADALWPDAEGDAALKSLGVALARLRKLLGRHDALVVNDESVSIDMQRVWIDVRALEHLIAEADPAASEGDGARASEIAARLLSLYRGEFLASDRDEPWALRPRVRVRARFVRCLAQIGARLEASQRWNLAADCYRRGLEADDVAEEFYQGLMRCHRALAQPAQGIAVFERLRQTLSAALGLEPSPATQRLAQELQAQHSQSVVNR